MDDRPSQKSSEMLRIAGKVILIPTYLGIFPIAYGLIGSWLGRYFEIKWLAVLFVFIGFYSGIRQSYLVIKRLKYTSEDQ
jgi:hypothetical protein